jgi:hypothetical protein
MLFSAMQLYFVNICSRRKVIVENLSFLFLITFFKYNGHKDKHYTLISVELRILPNTDCQYRKNSISVFSSGSDL